MVLVAKPQTLVHFGSPPGYAPDHQVHFICDVCSTKGDGVTQSLMPLDPYYRVGLPDKASTNQKTMSWAINLTILTTISRFGLCWNANKLKACHVSDIVLSPPPDHDHLDATSTMEFLQMREGISSSLAHHHITAPHQEIKGGLSPRWPQGLYQKVSTLDGM